MPQDYIVFHVAEEAPIKKAGLLVKYTDSSSKSLHEQQSHKVSSRNPNLEPANYITKFKLIEYLSSIKS